MHRELRRYENRLVVIGTGVVALGIWSIVKTIMAVIVRNENIFAEISAAEAVEEEIMSPEDIIAGIIALLFVIMIFVMIHLYIGFSARDEGFGKKNGTVYMIVALLYIILHIFTLIIDVMKFGEYFSSPLDGAVTIFIDATTTVTLIEMEHASFKVKLLKRKIKKAEAADER